MKLPISFEQFKTDPTKAILYLAMFALVYLYFDNKSVYKDQLELRDVKIERLERDVSELHKELLELAKSIKNE